MREDINVSLEGVPWCCLYQHVLEQALTDAELHVPIQLNFISRPHKLTEYGLFWRRMEARNKVCSFQELGIMWRNRANEHAQLSMCTHHTVDL
eukprot:1162143-Pelagomonas_calceolata.AAC.21